jgi:hypothetical protein
VALLAAAVAATVAVQADGDEQHEAAALVVANEVTIAPEQLPGFMQSVFESGAMRERIAGPVAADPAAVIPERVRLEPVEGTIAARVVARAAEARDASTLANLAARALVTELNRPGPGVGVFAVQDRARPSGAAIPQDRSTVAALAAAALAVLAVAAVAALWTAWRRPVTSSRLAADVVGTEVVGELVLPGDTADRADPSRVVGLDVLCRRLAAGGGTAVLVGSPRRREELDGLAQLLARVAARRFGEGTVRFDVVTGDVDVPQVVPAGARVALVVGAGDAEQDVLATAAPFADGDLSGVVLLHRPSLLARSRAWLAGRTERPAPAERVAGRTAPAVAAAEDGELVSG